MMPKPKRLVIWTLPHVVGNDEPLGRYKLSEAVKVLVLDEDTILRGIAHRGWFNTERHHVELEE